MDYQVDLDTFRGPLDLLLYLVKRNEVDICDIPIARIAEQFLDYLRVIKLIDVERAGDFLVMAATLMEIKSKTAPAPERGRRPGGGRPASGAGAATDRVQAVQGRGGPARSTGRTPA